MSGVEMSGGLPDDLSPLEESLLSSIGSIPADRRPIGLGPGVASELFEAQVLSRLVDHTARWLRSEQNLGYYTISSAGHESNAAVALALRPTDPAMLHYRAGAFFIARAGQMPDAVVNPVDDMLRGILARSTEPIAGGRHKVLGSHPLSIIPLTSTIGSHAPRSVGLAASFNHAACTEASWPEESVVVCGIGDASLNHSTVQGALNWASRLWFEGQRCPVLFVCEDNGIGISVPTPQGWVEASVADRPGLAMVQVDGQDPAGVLAGTASLVDHMRTTGQPGFLHLKTVRFMGHAGSDAEAAYRTATEIRDDYERDPLLASARLVAAAGDASGAELVQWYLVERQAIRQRAVELLAEPELQTVDEIAAPLAPWMSVRTAPSVDLAPSTIVNDAQPLTTAASINRALRVSLAADPNTLVFGEDVGRKGGVYGVTRGLQKEFGDRQVFDTILDEQSILGLALGAGMNGMLPIAEIQYLAYLHNAEDQLRGEAATMSFFSGGQFLNPMVVRIASYGYQKGFGGHYHNDNSVAVLTDVPGLVIASPAHPADAGPMLLSCVQLARSHGAVCAFLEPIARYHTTDLYDDGDGLWQAPVDFETAVSIGRARVHGDGADGTIVTWGNGLFLSLRAARRMRDEFDQDWRVVDLRWLSPMPIDDILSQSAETGRVLVVDETRRTGGVGERILAALLEDGFVGSAGRVAAADSPIPLGAAAELVLVSEQQIVDAAVKL